jgi:formylglycine-generating enzyme required for sulfatase activity
MKKLLFISAIIFVCASASANNIQVNNVSVVPANNTIKFDVSWENGWRSSALNNWDAAYVFFKIKLVDGKWYHLSLSATGAIIPSGFSVANNLTSTGVASGVFLYRFGAGSGTTNITNAEIPINNTIYATGAYDIKAFALEMVYVPTAFYYSGDGFSTNAYVNSYNFIGTSSFTDPLATTNPVSLPLFPNGYNAFYCMKYELSQGGYRDFLNALTYTQQVAHIVPAPSAAAGTYALFNLNRNAIKIKTPGVASTTPAVFGCDADNDGIFDETSDGEYIACNYLNWPDHAAYLAWSGLRPLTEFEFEKACRGVLLPVAGEYAWGNNQLSGIIYTLANPNQESETVSNSSASIGNANYNLTYPNAPNSGPLRNGIFATATSSRTTSGGGFYGIMDLSGNLYERVVTTATAQGQGFRGKKADIELTNDGYAYTAGLPVEWPGSTNTGSGGNVVGAVIANGLIYRGGSWGTNSGELRISDRPFVIPNNNTDRTTMQTVGVRGCVTAP